MLRLMSSRKSKLYSKLCSLWLTDFSCQARSLCTDSDAAAQRVTSLRRRRSVRRGSRSVAAEHGECVRNAVTDSDNVQTVHSSRMQRIKQHQIVPTDISINSLKHQLDDAVSIPLPDAELEFPSDILAEQKLEAVSQRDQGRHAFRPIINPMDTSVVLFPGQSSHFVGMGAKLLAYPAAEKMYRTASNILGYDLLDMCLHGPKDVLSKTVHSQPAVLVTSLAAVEKLKEVCPKVFLHEFNMKCIMQMMCFYYTHLRLLCNQPTLSGVTPGCARSPRQNFLGLLEPDALPVTKPTALKH